MKKKKIKRWRKIASLVPVCPFLGLGIKFLNLKVLLPVPLILTHFFTPLLTKYFFLKEEVFVTNLLFLDVTKRTNQIY